MSFEDAVDCVTKEAREKSKRMDNTKAISLLRVSSDRQFQEGNGIANQREGNREYMKKKGYEEHSELVVVETADPDAGEVRVDFEDALSHCIKHKKEVDVVVIWKIDRFSRSGASAYWILKAMLTKHGIRLESATEHFDDSPSGEFMQSLLAATARYDNRIRTDRTIGAEKLLVRQGYWCRPAPTGFVNGKKIVGYINGKPIEKPILLPHPEAKQWELLCYGLRKQLSGAFDLSEVARELEAKGFLMKEVRRNGKVMQNPPSAQSWGKLCRRAVYGGLIHNKWTEGEYIRAQFDGPLTLEEWHRLQDALPKLDEESPRKRRRKLNPDAPLRRFLRCPHCDHPARGSASIGKMKKRYLYYDCPNKSCGFRMDAEEVHTQFVAYLTKVKPTPRLLSLFDALVMQHWENELKELNRESIALGEEVSDLKKQKRDLVTLMAASKNDAALLRDLKEQYAELDTKVATKTIQRNEKEIAEYDAETVIAYCNHFMENTSELWDNAEVEDQNRLQSLIFPTGIPHDVLENKRTPKMSLVYEAIGQLDAGGESLAGPRGIEPRFSG